MPITQSSKLKNLPANSKEQYGPNTEGWPHLLYWGMDLHFQQCHNALLPLSWKNSINAVLLTCYTCIYLGKTTPKKKKKRIRKLLIKLKRVDEKTIQWVKHQIKEYNTMPSPVMNSMTSFLAIFPNRNLLPENS